MFCYVALGTALGTLDPAGGVDGKEYLACWVGHWDENATVGKGVGIKSGVTKSRMFTVNHLG